MAFPAPNTDREPGNDGLATGDITTDGEIIVDPIPQTEDVQQRSAQNLNMVLFSVTISSLIKKLKKLPKDELEKLIEENKEVDKILEGDTSKAAQKVQLEHGITEDELKKRQ